MASSRVPSQISIRFATKGDVRRVLKIDRVAFAQQWDYDIFTSALQDLFFVFEEKKILKKILGFLVARHSEVDNSVMIRKFAVDPRHRNKGIGRRLIQAVLNELTKRNVRAVDLHVHPSNTGAIRLYERFGFTIVKMEKPHYGEDEEFYLMRRKLGHAV